MNKFLLFFLVFFKSQMAYGSPSETTLHFEVSQAKILEQFFRVATSEEELGYVLLGNKPVCYCRFSDDLRDFYVDTRYIGLGYNYQEGVLAWQASPLANKNGNFRICAREITDENRGRINELLFINCQAFIQTVNQNLSLFQYVLGPKLSANGLLDQVLHSDKSFYDILHDDKVLVGILLGFGTDGALYGSRHEEIFESPFMQPVPPFQSEECKGAMATNVEVFLEINYSPCELAYFNGRRTTPSFGFSSLTEEYEALGQQMETSSPSLQEKQPRFIFGNVKENVKQDTLIASLEKQQQAIIELLASPDFLDQVLAKFGGDRSQLSSEVEKIDLPIDTIASVIAEQMWYQWKRLEAEHFDSLIEGILGTPRSEVEVPIFQFFQQKNIRTIKSTLDQTEKFLEGLKSNSEVHWASADKVGYRILQKGDGDEAVKSSNAYLTLSYVIGLGDDALETDSRILALPVTVKLAETIPGFALGVVGMKSGEVREVFIHPDFAYGLYTSLEKGRYLKAKVRLIEILDDNQAISKPIIPRHNTRESLDLVDKHWSDEKLELVKSVYAYYEGNSMFLYYKNLVKELSPDTVVEKLRFLQSGNSFSMSEREKERVMNLIHMD